MQAPPALQGDIKKKLAKFRLGQQAGTGTAKGPCDNGSDGSASTVSPLPPANDAVVKTPKRSRAASFGHSGSAGAAGGSSSPDMVLWQTTPQAFGPRLLQDPPCPAERSISTPCLRDTISDVWESYGLDYDRVDRSLGGATSESPTPSKLALHKGFMGLDSLREPAQKRRKTKSADGVLASRVSSLVDSIENVPPVPTADPDGPDLPSVKAKTPLVESDPFEMDEQEISAIATIEASWLSQRQKDETSVDVGDTPVTCEPPQVEFVSQLDLTGIADEMFESDFSDGEVDPSASTTHLTVYTVSSVQSTGAHKLLTVTSKASCDSSVVCLQGQWSSTQIQEGCSVYFEGRFDQVSEMTIIDDAQGHLVLHPEFLITATKVADSATCLRKAVLQEHIRDVQGSKMALVVGCIVHETFQICLVEKDFTETKMESVMHERIHAHIKDIACLPEPVSYDQACNIVRPKLLSLRAWAAEYYSTEMKPLRVRFGDGGRKKMVRISRPLDVEESIWCPRYGLKGNIDVTMEVLLKQAPNSTTETLIMPFELKTGKLGPNTSHQAQIMLYTIMLQDRYSVPVQSGLLFYSEPNEMVIINQNRPDIVALIMLRNSLASYISSKEMPSVLKYPFTCEKCFAKVGCAAYHKLAEDGTSESFGLDVIEAVGGQVSQADRDFFKHWDRLLISEEKAARMFQHELWTADVESRVKSGLCVDSLIASKIEPLRSGCEVQFRVYFESLHGEISENLLTPSDRILVSSKTGRIAMARGTILDISSRHMSVLLNHAIIGPWNHLEGFDSEVNQVFEGNYLPHKSSDSIEFRVDRDDMASVFSMIRSNLLRLFTEEQSQKIRSSIVHLKAPSFEVKFRSDATKKIEQELELNGDQISAVHKALSANDYALILGMPGTGKTISIVALIRCLLSQGKSVLLSCYTHSAIDNVLLKLLQYGVKGLRIGEPSKVHPDLRQYCADACEETAESTEALLSVYRKNSLVACTCLATGHALFHVRRFDVCIVDEASQVTLPTCIGPLLCADKFVLVGDHNQLPPLVKDKSAANEGLDVSLFKLLCDVHPGSIQALRHQYRMHADIMALSNDLIYDGQLVCGLPEQNSKWSISLPKYSDFKLKWTQTGQSQKSLNWLERVLDPQEHVLFLDTDALEAWEQRNGEAIHNPTEAEIALKCISAFYECGISADEMGIITPYRAQLRYLSKHKQKSLSRVEVNTIDRFQGLDKDVIIMSFVRSNKDGNVGSLLPDERRLNVSVTRAKRKLVMIGSARLLSCNQLLKQVVNIMATRKQILKLPADLNVRNTLRLSDENLPPSPPPPKGKTKRSFMGAKALHGHALLRDITNENTNGF